MDHFQCETCGKKDALVFQCNYCHRYYCVEHHLPESHDCSNKPRTNPHYVKPSEENFHYKEKYHKPLPETKHYSQKQYSKKRLTKKVVKFSAIAIIAIILLWTAYSILQQSIQNSSTPNMPTSTAPYVEVKYWIVGWFYSENWGSSYNYTYLVLNVTIISHGYSKVNTIGDFGFDVVINNNVYGAPHQFSGLYMYNVSTINRIYNEFRSFSSYYFKGLDLPSPATLLDTGSINGLVVFQFGDPNVYPQPAQILNEPFTLEYSVTYGDAVTLYEPKAKVVINQIG